MKKTISLLLALVMCLSLCACGVDEKYAPLLENLDAGNYEGIKDALIELSPEFKADAEKLAKYQSLIDLLEAENYEDALVDVENRIPVPECEIIEITMDNWDEYFEIVPDHYWIKNAFGEGRGLTIGFSLFLKDEYASRLSKTDNSTIACTVSFDAREKTLDVNWKETTFTEVDYIRVVTGASSSGIDGGRWPEKPFEEACEITSKLNASIMVPWSEGDRFASNLFYYNVDHYDDVEFYNFYFGENFSMVRITGTLELLVE